MQSNNNNGLGGIDLKTRKHRPVIITSLSSSRTFLLKVAGWRASAAFVLNMRML